MILNEAYPVGGESDRKMRLLYTRVVGDQS
jgi:hypothetical protein